MLLVEYYGLIPACLIMLSIIIGLTGMICMFTKVAINGIVENIKERRETKKKETI